MQLHRVRHLSVAAFASVALMVVVGAVPADAWRKAPTRPPAPTVAPTPTSVNWFLIRPDLAQGIVRPNSQFVEHQLLSGPGVVTPAPIVRGTRGVVSLLGLQPASTYTLRVRNSAAGVAPSAWTTFSLTTAATFASRPNPPKNLRIQQATATRLTVAWDGPDSEFYSYEAFIGSSPLDLGGGYNLETQTRSIPRPAPGTTSTFSVAARDSQLNLSLPATLEVSSTSAP